MEYYQQLHKSIEKVSIICNGPKKTHSILQTFHVLESCGEFELTFIVVKFLVAYVIKI